MLTRENSDSDIGQAADLANCYDLKDSVWDASLLLGYTKLGYISNTLLLLGLLINIFVQVTFSVLVIYLPHVGVGDSYTSTGIEAFETWHLRVDEATRKGVCTGDESLTTSFHQFDVYGEARDYTRRIIDDFTFEMGTVLCSIVLFTWLLSMCNAIQNILFFVSAVIHGHSYNSEVMRMDRVLKSDKSFAFSEIPTRRVLLILFIGLIQLAIALTLMVCGAWWLIATTKNTDLILNGLALTYIMEIDELIFDAIVPKEVRYIISNTVGLSLRSEYRTTSCRVFFPLRSCVNLGSLVAMFTVFYRVMLLPHQQRVRDVQSAICPLSDL